MRTGSTGCAAQIRFWYTAPLATTTSVRRATLAVRTATGAIGATRRLPEESTGALAARTTCADATNRILAELICRAARRTTDRGATGSQGRVTMLVRVTASAIATIKKPWAAGPPAHEVWGSTAVAIAITRPIRATNAVARDHSAGAADPLNALLARVATDWSVRGNAGVLARGTANAQVAAGRVGRTANRSVAGL
jgi:hypothetical protein